MQSAFLVLAIACLAGSVIAPYNVAGQFPEQFIATWRYFNEPNNTILEGGDWYYDYTNQLLREDHTIASMKAGIPLVSGVFLKSNFYLVQQSKCCLCFPGLGMTAPDFASRNATTIVQGLWYPGMGITVDQYNFVAMGAKHAFLTSSLTQLPVALTSADQVISNLTSADDQWIDVYVVQPPASAFNFPACQTATACPAPLPCASSADGLARESSRDFAELARLYTPALMPALSLVDRGLLTRLH